MKNDNRIDIGQLVTSSQQRDAIHIAIIPIMAGEAMNPGTRVTLNKAGQAIDAGDCNAGIGVVSPFLLAPVQPGDVFWLLLNPGTIRTLRHEWSSDVFPLEPVVAIEDGYMRVSHREVEASATWLRKFAEDNFNEGRETAEAYYNDMVSSFERAGEEAVFLQVHGSSRSRELQEDFSELQRHLENVIGKRLPRNRDNTFFTCWC